MNNFLLPFDSPSFPTNIVIDSKVTATPDIIDAANIMGEVMFNAALAHPTWQFTVVSASVRTPRDGGANRYFPVKVVVRSNKNVVLGRLAAFSHNFYNDKIEISNERITRQMQRGNCLSTSKPDKALKLIKKHFGEPSPLELANEASQELRTHMHHAMNGFGSTFSTHYKKLTGHLLHFILDNLDEIYTRVPNAHLLVTKEVLHDSYENYSIASGVEGVPNTDRLTVVIQDDKYVLHRAGSPVMVKTSDQLPEPVRAAIGMLKLVDDKQFVRNIGYRLSNQKFMVVYGGDLG